MLYVHFKKWSPISIIRNKTSEVQGPNIVKEVLKSKPIELEAKSDGRCSYLVQYFSRPFRIFSASECLQMQQISVKHVWQHGWWIPSGTCSTSRGIDSMVWKNKIINVGLLWRIWVCFIYISMSNLSSVVLKQNKMKSKIGKFIMGKSKSYILT